MKSKRWISIVSYLWLVCLVVGLTGCGHASTTPTPVSSTETPTPLPPLCILRSKPENQQASNGFFIDNQVIVMGPKSGVEEILKPAGLGSIDVSLPMDNGSVTTLQTIEDCDLSFLGSLELSEKTEIYPPLADGKKSSQPPFQQVQYSTLIMRLYEISAGTSTTIEEVIGQINTSGKQIHVYADPNYLTDLSGSDSCGEPFSGGGSPFSGGGSPYAGPGIPTGDVSNEFMTQWALSSIDIISSPSAAGPGAGIKIGVFDTSPFGRLSSTEINQTFTVSPSTSTGLTLSLPLFVSDAILAPVGLMSTKDISDHGLFVAGLIHSISSASEIHLIRVLNDDGCGTLNTITSAIFSFSRQMTHDQGNLNNIVINLSLGIHIPDEFARLLHSTKAKWDLLPKDLVTFTTAINTAYSKGAVIVAAAGNDSPGKDLNGVTIPVMPMQYPAAYEVVIGAAASNMEGISSCYSNQGDVAAPGGNGGPNLPSATPVPGSDITCVSRASTWNIPSPSGIPMTCATMKDCPYGLISFSQKVTGAPSLIFWAGTSFSTPLVSGLAALAYEKSRDKNKAYCLVLNGAANHPVSNARGIISISDSLLGDVPKNCGVP